MSIKEKTYKRKDGSVRRGYQAVVAVQGGKQVAKNFSRLIDAERWERDQRSRLDKGQGIVPSSQVPTVAELSERWLEEYSKVRKADSSYARDRKYVKHQILPHLAAVKLTGLNAVMVERWMNTLCEGLSPKSVNAALGLLKKMLNDAVRWGLIHLNPIVGVRPLKLSQRDYQFWSQLEAEKALTYIKDFEPEKYPGFVLALNTGMRRGELRALTWDAVNLDLNLIEVKQSYCEYAKKVKCTKSRKIRRLPINTPLRDLLVQLRGSQTGPLVLPEFRFCNSTKAMQRICAKAGIRVIRFHDLRHTFASHFMMNGGRLYDLQQLLGHSSSQMTERYAHLAPEHLAGKTSIIGFSISDRPANVIRLGERR